MELTTLSAILLEEAVEILPHALRFTAPARWVVNDERRVSYTTLIRLAECCRELHWQDDVAQLCTHEVLDATCATVHANFRDPIFIDTAYIIRYKVIRVGETSYELLFQIIDEQISVSNVEISMICVFINPVTGKPVRPPAQIAEQLRQLIRSDERIYK